jgi:hypothetical protein
MFKIRAVCEIIGKTLVSRAFVCMNLRGSTKGGDTLIFL